MVFSAFVKTLCNVLEQELSDCTFTDDSILRTCVSLVTQYKKLAVGFPSENLATDMELVGFRLGESPEKNGRV